MESVLHHIQLPGIEMAVRHTVELAWFNGVAYRGGRHYIRLMKYRVLDHNWFTLAKITLGRVNTTNLALSFE